MEITNQTWTWLILGGVLLASEIFTGTLHLLFFGVAALITAAVSQWVFPDTVTQILVFAGLALLALWYAQKKGVVKGSSKGFEADVAQTIVLSHGIRAGSEATIQYQGAPWTAVNQSPTDLERGQKAVITKTEGVRLYIKPAKE